MERWERKLVISGTTAKVLKEYQVSKEETQRIIIGLKEQVEEANNKKETLKNLLEEKDFFIKHEG